MASVVAIWLGAGVAQTVSAGDNTHGADHDMTHEDHHEEGATHAMSVAHVHMGPHMKWTTRRTLTADDEAGEVIVGLRQFRMKRLESVFEGGAIILIFGKRRSQGAE